jgi:hypothetical protein
MKKQQKLGFEKETLANLSAVQGGGPFIDVSRVDYPPIQEPPIEQEPAFSVRGSIRF